MSSHSGFKTLRLDRLCRSFGSINALHDVSLEIKRGEFIALLGPSGSGKSTALNCISGLMKPTSGSIWLDDRQIDTMAVEDRGFGMVFQNYALFPHMSVRNNIAFGLRMRGMAKEERENRVEIALRAVRLDSHADALPCHLSGGQQQRVALARAMAIDPPLMMMDEPLSNLDATLRLEMRQEIRRLHEDLGCATLYVTHDLDEALSMADRIVVLRDGAIQQIGEPRDIYQRPNSIAMAEFMGFRNHLKGERIGDQTAVLGAQTKIMVEGISIEGIVMNELSNNAVIAMIRPDDLYPASGMDKGLGAVIGNMEYHGKSRLGYARTAQGTELFFTSELDYAVGSAVQLKADPAKVLLYSVPDPVNSKRSH